MKVLEDARKAGGIILMQSEGIEVELQSWSPNHISTYINRGLHGDAFLATFLYGFLEQNKKRGRFSKAKSL